MNLNVEPLSGTDSKPILPLNMVTIYSEITSPKPTPFLFRTNISSQKPKILNNALSTSICLKILLSRFGYCQNLMAANLPSKSFNCKTMDYSLIKKSILRSCISTLFKTTSILSPNAYSLFGFFRFVLCTKPSIPI